MNRLIKFRTWDKEDKEMSHDPHMSDCHDINTQFEDESIVYMQFTGMQDKNGNDIYEGDIIVDHVGRGEVEYSYKYAGFRVNYKDGQCKWFYDYNLRGERDSIEVVGNVFES